MDPLALGSGAGYIGLPRVSGDGPKRSAAIWLFREAAPRERGWTHPDATPGWSHWGCPA